MIQANNICLAFGGQDVFKDISFNISDDQRIGLVGRNGSGKSTLLKAIVENSVLDSGKITIVKSKRIAYMPQDVVLSSNKSILEEVLSTFELSYKLKKEAEELEKQIEICSTAELLEQYSAVQ